MCIHYSIELCRSKSAYTYANKACRFWIKCIILHIFWGRKCILQYIRKLKFCRLHTHTYTERENNLSFEESNSEYVFGFGKIKISHKCSKISATKGNKTDFGCLNNGHMIHYLAVI